MDFNKSHNKFKKEHNQKDFLLNKDWKIIFQKKNLPKANKNKEN